MSDIDIPVRLSLAPLLRPGEACHVAVRHHRPGAMPAPHTHDFAEAFWIERGRGMHLTADGRQPLEPGSLVLVAPDDVHGFATAERDGYRIVNLAFPLPAWASFVARHLPDGDPLAVPLARRSYRLGRAELQELQRFAAELLAGARHARALERFWLNLLFVLREQSPAGETPLIPPWLRHALAGLTPAGLERGVPALVAACDKSAEHVARECRRCFGKTPTELVNALRLDHAARLLLETEASVVNLALACGFSNLSHFYRLFRDRHGVTPAEHRARGRKVLGG